MKITEGITALLPIRHDGYLGIASKDGKLFLASVAIPLPRENYDAHELANYLVTAANALPACVEALKLSLAAMENLVKALPPEFSKEICGPLDVCEGAAEKIASALALVEETQ